MLSLITKDSAYDECLKGMEAFLRKQVEGRYWFTGADPYLWPNDYEQDSIWSVVEYWLGQYDRTQAKACLDRAVADAYLSFLRWCPKQLSWVQRPTVAHCEQQHYTQYSVYCYHNRKVECLDRLARATQDPLFRSLVIRVMQLNFFTQLTEGDQTGAFSEAIADPWGERSGDFNFVGTPYMNELSLEDDAPDRRAVLSQARSCRSPPPRQRPRPEVREYLQPLRVGEKCDLMDERKG